MNRISQSASVAIKLSAMIIALSGCENKLDEASVCSSGGECCALSFATDVDGNAKPPTWWKCVKDSKCPPAEFEGRTTYPVFPATPSDEGNCGAKFKNGWIWQSSSVVSDIAASTLNSIRTAAIATLPPVRRPDGTVVVESDGDYCSIQCSNPTEDVKAVYCQGAVVKNDLSLALLRLTTELVKVPPTENKIIPISDVLAKFRVPPEALSNCPRQDVIITNGILVNQGNKECSSEGQVLNSELKINASLVTPAELRADIKSFKGVAVFSGTDGTAFSLKWDGKNTNEYYGGPIVYAADVNSTDVSVGISGQHGIQCAAIQPEVTKANNLHHISRIANSNPRVVSDFFRDLKGIESASTPASGISNSGAVKLLPISDELERLNKMANRADEISQLKYLGSSEYKKQVLTAKDMSLLVDSVRCEQYLNKSVGENYTQLIPEFSNADSSVLDERNRIAGELIMCKFAPKLLTEEWRHEVMKVFGKLP